MTEHEIREIVETQRKFFYTGAVLDVDYRIQALKKLQTLCSHRALSDKR